MGHATTQRKVEDSSRDPRVAAAFRRVLRRERSRVHAVYDRRRLDHAEKNCYLDVSTFNPPGRASTERGSRRRSK
jgi:hypothetical protein